MNKTLHVKLKAKQEGQYTLYVFEDLEQPSDSIDKYLTVVLLPNWCGALPDINQQGYLTFEIASNGQEYLKRSTGETSTYNYDRNYFIAFIPEIEKNTVKEFKF